MLQTSQKGGQGQHSEVPVAYSSVAARAGTPQLCRGGRGGPESTGRAGCRCGMKGASSLPRRRHPVRYSSETATGVPPLFRSRPPVPTAWANAGPRLSINWTQGRRTRRIKGPSLTARPPPASPKPPPRASRRSFRGRGGKRFRNPGARECRFERLSGSWESTVPPCNFSSYPTGLCTIILKQRRLGVSGRGRPEWMPWEQPGRAWGCYEFGVVVSTSTQRVTHLQPWPTI